LGLRPTFSFLDPHHILVGFLWTSESQPRELLVCALDSQRMLDVDDGPIDTVSTYLFRIPKVLKRHDYWEIHTHRNSVPLRSGCPSSSASTSAGALDHHYFDNDPADQLVVIEMASRRHRSPTEKLDPAMALGIPARTILRRIARARPSQPPQPPPPATPGMAHPPLVFSWEQWGERGGALITKRFDVDRRLPNLSRVCGLRGVTRKPVVRPDGGPAVFRVYDFHPGRAMRIAQSRTSGNGGGGGGCGSSSSSTSSLVHAVIEVPLPVEMQDVDPALISTSICQDALIAFEVRGTPLFFHFSPPGSYAFAVCVASLSYDAHTLQRMDLNLSGLRRVFVCSF